MVFHKLERVYEMILPRGDFETVEPQPTLQVLFTYAHHLLMGYA